MNEATGKKVTILLSSYPPTYKQTTQTILPNKNIPIAIIILEIFILLDFIGKSAQNLFQWDETGGVSGTNTGSTVTDWLVGHGEFTNVVVDHFWLDFDLVEDFYGVSILCCIIKVVLTQHQNTYYHGFKTMKHIPLPL